MLESHSLRHAGTGFEEGRDALRRLAEYGARSGWRLEGVDEHSLVLQARVLQSQQ